MERAIFTSPIVPMVNRVVFALLDAPVLGRVVGDGAPVELLGIDGRDRIAHAVANRDERGRVTVTVGRS
jgi:hypothetical protein